MTITPTPEAHFDGDRLKIDPTKAFRLTIVIDNNEREDYPDNPFTLNATFRDLEDGGDEREDDLTFGFWDGMGGEGCLIDGTIPQQLRDLADLIEQGRVGR